MWTSVLSVLGFSPLDIYVCLICAGLLCGGRKNYLPLLARSHGCFIGWHRVLYSHTEWRIFSQNLALTSESDAGLELYFMWDILGIS